MKKVVIVLTLIVLGLSIGFASIKVNEYLSYDKIKTLENKIKVTKKEIKSLDKKIKSTKEEALKIKESKKEKVELLEVWEKQLKKMEKNS